MPVLIWILTCTISNSLYFVFLLCSIIIAIVISDGCMSGNQAICMDLNKWCISFIYTCQVVYIFHIHLLGGVYEQVFRVKKLVGLPPQLELLADSVTSQVHDNLFKLTHTESIGMHILHSCMGRQTRTDCAIISFFPLLIRSSLNNPAIHT